MHNMKKTILVQCMQHYYLFYICLCISFQLSRQCGPGAGVNHYSNVKKSILRRQPDLHETSIHASGEFTRPIPRDDPRLEPPVITTEIVFENYDLKSEARKAIEPCRDALIRLAEEVKEHWKREFRIKVTHGYTSNKKAAGRHILHMEGRAFDLTLITAPKKGVPIKSNQRVSLHNLQRLAGLAYYRAKFSFVEVRRTHVHVSCRKDNIVSPDRSRCFPANSYVRGINNEKILMKNLQVGTKVLTIGADGAPLYSDVIMMMHKQENMFINDYINIKTDSGQQITLSSHHLIYTLKDGYIFSKDVTINQSLYNYNSKSNSFNISRVIAIDFVTKKGAYAPLSMDGTIVVNDVYTSCYALFPSHVISHHVFSIWRFVYKYFNVTKVTATTDYHWYPNIFRSFINSISIFPYKF